MSRISRRQFVKRAIITSAAMAAFPAVLIPKARAAWVRKTVVHPNINNLLVVGITDARMTKANEPISSWARQQKLVIPEVVWENMDNLACRLAETRNPADSAALTLLPRAIRLFSN
jgi:hypothetical protein